MVVPKPTSTDAKTPHVQADEGRTRAEEDWQVVTIPSAVRVHRWTARNRAAMAAGPSLGQPPLSYAGRPGR